MVRRTLAAVATGIAVALALAPTGPAGAGTPPNGPGTAGPPYDYATELMGEELGKPLVPLPDKAMITRSKHGYLYRAGQQHNRLTVTFSGTSLRFVDTGTRSFHRLAAGCVEQRVWRGVAAVCPVPTWISVDRPVLLEVWPRLGNDHVNVSTLPASFAVTVLGDAGDEVVRFGAGPDFFNGFTGRDRVFGGGGNDWIRLGPDADVVRGGGADDQLVGQDGDDVMYGDAGDDRLGGMGGRDRLVGGSGRDFLLCSGIDNFVADLLDRLLGCGNRSS
ncbi:calcium-binding protein [Nocardioides sp. TF02-7]|uniref:calcium-binding protein n=1 Tax=Nocardioides sp. TF02-7 TaxID=2917724 RepID=UPI001F068644|nr:calcium-binding protein [Nocardioides sp. TF02-7]UMG91082.1 hypothetical protein MF408_12795 [Nocardioides sp. TF02-7]